MMFKIFLSILLFLLCNLQSIYSENSKNDLHTTRIKIGPTTSSPIKYGDKIYFLAANGILYKSDLLFQKVENIFQTDIPTMSGLLLYKDVIYFGDGMHKDQKGKLYAIDLKTEKTIFKFPLGGHIERLPLIRNNILYVGLGPKGIVSIDTTTQKEIWRQNKVKKGKLHIDSSPQYYKGGICVASVYDFKGIACLDELTGKEIITYSLKISPKSEIQLAGNKLYGISTTGNLMETKWLVDSYFYVINLDLKKVTVQKKLRGFNFFIGQAINNNHVFLTLSSGDFIMISLSNGDIGYVGEYSEPFVSTPFISNKQFCSIGIMGMLRCYKRKKDKFILSLEKRYYESPIGRITAPINNTFYIPSRIGFLTIKI